MKKNYIFKFILLLIPVSAFLLMSSTGGRSDGRSGSPGDGGNTCSACHNGGNFNSSSDITTNIPITGYELNTNYNITINTTSSAPSYGFQLVAENSSNTKVGSFTAGSGSQVLNNRITHSSPNNTGDWTFVWTSPSTDVGNVTFYAAINCANGNGGAFDGADQTITTSTSFPSLSTKRFNALAFDMYPNPASNSLNIDLPNGAVSAKVEFYDYVGKLALRAEISPNNNSINVSDLSSGMYILKVITDNKIGSKKFIKQ